MQLFDHPYSEFLPRVLKPNRYTGREHGAVRKDWSAVEARVCLAFPDIYDIGMSHLGYRILYKILNDDPRILAERCYTPWLDMLAELEARGLPLASLESARPLREFDVVGFSLQFELTYTNILLMLDRGGIPLRASDRGETDPLVIAGGPVATHPEPIAPFLDAILIGDGEEATKEMTLSWTEGKKLGLSRRERLLRLASITGVYVPSLYETALEPETGAFVVSRPSDPRVPFPVERRLVPNLDDFPFPDEFPVGGPEAIFDRMSIEVARGCTEGCRFCQAGMIYRPVRERDPETVVATVLRALEKSGQDEVSLTALSTADVSCISPLIKKLVEKTAPERVSLSVASLRAYGLAEDLLDDMKRVRASGLTFAPEAGTQRMRDVINKNVTEEQLLETAERVFSRGFDKMKLYFILGLPTETDEDVLGIASVGQNAYRVGRRVGARPTVTVSVSVHVPKPHTPFQWAAMDPVEEVVRKQNLLRDALRRQKGITLRVHDSKTSELEGVLARGDRRIADVIERAYRAGARYDSWSEHFKKDVWLEAFAHFSIDPNGFLGTIPLSARLPWSHIDVGLEDGFLAREYQKALASRLSPPCGKARGAFVHPTNVADAVSDKRKLVCYDCGIACDLTRMREHRTHMLEKMGALEPTIVRLPLVGDQAGDPPVVDAPEKKSKRTLNPELARPERAGREERFRLAFEKTGAQALLGHLDFIRELPRVIRRAGVRTAYTKGFHPKPDMSFGPALPLGTASLEEFLDIKLVDAPSEEEVLRGLARAASPGLRFTSVQRLSDSDPGLMKIIDEARYAVLLPRPVLERRGLLATFPELVRAFVERESATVVREVKGIKRNVDVKAGVLEFGLLGEDDAAAVSRAGIVGDLVGLAVKLRVDPAGSVRPSEVVAALLGDPEFPHLTVRLGLLGGGRSPLDLLTHRRPPRVVVAPSGPPEVEFAPEV